MTTEPGLFARLVPGWLRRWLYRQHVRWGEWHARRARFWHRLIGREGESTSGGDPGGRGG